MCFPSAFLVVDLYFLRPFIYLILFNIKNSAFEAILRVLFMPIGIFGGVGVLKSKLFLFY